MSSFVFVKIFGGLTAAATIGTGGYLLSNNFAKSKNKAKRVQEEEPEEAAEETTVEAKEGKAGDSAPPTPPQGSTPPAKAGATGSQK